MGIAINVGLIMGTIHGANVGICEEAGREANHVIFGALDEELLGILSNAKANRFIFGAPEEELPGILSKAIVGISPACA